VRQQDRDATWARRLSITPYRLHVQGTAGSGKTQLALDELREARIAGRRAMYLCFNHPLAEAMQRAAPTTSICSTFHELAASLMREQDQPIDYTQPGIFDRIAQGFIDSAERLRGIVDVLVIDEGQDFEPAWTPALLGMVKPEGRCLWLEDPAQNIYARAPAAPAGWVRLSSVNQDERSASIKMRIPARAGAWRAQPDRLPPALARMLPAGAASSVIAVSQVRRGSRSCEARPCLDVISTITR